MANIVSNSKFVLNKQWKYSSSVQKSAILGFDGRSASIFRINADYCINPWFYILQLINLLYLSLIIFKTNFSYI